LIPSRTITTTRITDHNTTAMIPIGDRFTCNSVNTTTPI